MKKLLLLLLAFCVITTSTVHYARATDPIADTPENREEQAARYLAIRPSREVMVEMAKSVTVSMPAEQREQVIRLFSTDLNMDAITKVMHDALVKTFTAEELRALADFYGSPAGKSAMSKFSIYVANFTPPLRAEVRKVLQNGAHPTPNP